MHKITIAGLLLAGALGSYAQKIRGADLPRGVSLIQLISSPEKYDHRQVMVMGVLGLQTEGDGIYLTMDDYAHASRFNRVRIEANRTVNGECEGADGKYVVIEGEYVAPGATEDSTGRLTNITRCSLWTHTNPPPSHR